MKGGGDNARVLAAIGVTLLIWASAFAGIRAGLRSYAPGELVLLRFLVASGVLAAYALATRMPPPTRRDLPRFLLCGFLGFTVYHAGLSFGERSVEAGSASLLIASVPVFTALLARAFLGEKLGGGGWIGTTVSFLGVALIAFGEGTGIALDPGVFPIVGAAIGESIFFVLQKPLLDRYGSLRCTTYSIWAGTLFVLPWAPGVWSEFPRASFESTASIVYLGLFPTVVAYVALAYAFSRLPASSAVSFLYAIPVLAFVVAYVWLGETPTLLSAVGGAVALAGVVVVNARPASEAAVE